MLNNCHLSRLVGEQAAKYGSRTALSYRDYATGRWMPVSWNQFSDTVDAVARSLLALGVGAQENIATFSQNKPECFFVDFGAYKVRAVTIPFYATSSGAQMVYMMNDADVRFLFVGEQEQYDTAVSVASHCGRLERIIIFDPEVRRCEKDGLSMYFSEFLSLGREADVASEMERRLGDACMTDLANILYTSGTTGASKGVMLTYGMYHEAFRANDLVLPVSEKDVVLDFLPLTHIFERAWSYFCLAQGAKLAVNLRPADVLRSLQEVHPTCMSSVPRFWEKVYRAVLDKMENSGPALRKLIGAALETGGTYWTEYASRGVTPPLALRLRYAFFSRTIIRYLRHTLGLEDGNIFPVAGATVSPEVERFVHAAGLNIIVGYGLTESTATVSCDVMGQPITTGSVGRVIDGLELKIGDNNEILLRGKTITPGYYKKERLTADTIDADGWFHTGDAGYLRNGELFLTERIKDMFKTSNGKYISPQLIETKLTLDKYIDQAVVVADRRKFVAALIVPVREQVERYAAAHDIAWGSIGELYADARIQKLFAARIETMQQDLAHYEKVKRFLLLTRPFSMETGELTNTLKVRRAVVYEHYAESIDRLYEEAEQEQAARA